MAAVALGSNLGDRSAHLDAAFRALAKLPGSELLARSTVIETDPVGPPGQDPYLNAAALLSTTLSPAELLDDLLAIERARGRRRVPGERWGPRTLDLDLLTHGQTVLDHPGLTLPHPRLHERLFVLRPLAQIAPDLPIPPEGRTPAYLLAALEASSST